MFEIRFADIGSQLEDFRNESVEMRMWITLTTTQSHQHLWTEDYDLKCA